MNIDFGFDDKIRKRAGTSIVSALALPLFAWLLAFTVQSSEPQVVATPANLLPLTSVRLLAGPFGDAVKANRTYLLAIEPDRLLAPYLREAGLETKAKFQYSLSPRGEKSVELAVTYWGGDAGRAYGILANGELLATETVDNSKPNQYFEKQYALTAKFLHAATNGRGTINFPQSPAREPVFMTCG